MNFSSVLWALLWATCGVTDARTSVFPFPDSPHLQPFEINVDQTFLDMTLRKVRDYRPTTGLSDHWNIEGPPQENMTAVANYWSNSYDWKAVEDEMNREFEHFVTSVPGSGNYTNAIPLHYVHQRAKEDAAMPLLLLHGWPSSFLEWSRVIAPLSQSSKQAFHIVAPDLPGFGFSPAPHQAGLGPRELSRALDALMLQLGYARYGLATTDLGWFTAMWMVNEVEEHIIGHFSDFYISTPQQADREHLQSGLASKEEVAYISAFDNWFGSHWAYATIHSQKPLALAQALADSPVGLLGWYWDVNYATSDGYQYNYKQIITDAMMLWIPGPYANIRMYLEYFKPYVMNFPASNTPTGVTQWGWGNSPFRDIAEFPNMPKSWIERTSNLVYFRRHPSGGHFPAVSHPDQWIEDVQEFFSGLLHSNARNKDEL